MTKRANGEGSAPVWKAATHRWQANYTAADGTRKTVSSSIPGPAGEAECRAKRDDALALTRRGDLPLPAKLTVGAWLDEWLTVHKAKLSRTSIENYRQNVRDHMKVIANKPLNGPDRLRRTDVQRMLNGVAERGLSESMQQHVFDILKAGLKQAVADERMARSPLDGMDRPGRDTPDFVPWTDEQAIDFLESVQGDRLEALWNVALLCGLRKGELLGLRWADITWSTDERPGTITVAGQLDRQTHVWKATRKANGKTVVMVMPDRAEELLRVRQTQQKRERIKAGRGWLGNRQDLVFTTRQGGPIQHGNLWTEWRTRVRRVDGLPLIKFHGTRHFVASFQRSQGASVDDIATMLGQDDRDVTKTYVHPTHQVAQAAAERANALPLRPRKAAER